MSDRGKKIRWNKASVITLAGDLADAEGLDAVTLTRLAEAMGVKPPSLFNHIDSRNDLVRELALAATLQLAALVESSAPSTPVEALERMMAAYRAFVSGHPGRYEASLVVSRQQASTDGELHSAEERVVAVGLKVAAGFGLAGPQAIHALRGWRAMAHGFCDLERRGGFGIPLDCDESYHRAVQALTPR